jgi:hypothetical protein
MRRVPFALMMIAVVTASAASRAAAQMPLPPSINKPIEAAKKAAGATSAQTQQVNTLGASVDAKGQRPAEAATATSANAPSSAAVRAQQQSSLQAQRDSVVKANKATTAAGVKGAVTFYREVYTYSDEGRRDPFVSLMATGEMRPLLADLVLVGVIYDGAGRNSVASLIDGTTNESYRVKVGNVLGRMKVVKIGPQEITLDIDEFGFSRQETLLIDHTRKAGSTPGRRP